MTLKLLGHAHEKIDPAQPARFDPASGHIKLAGPGLTASTVSNDPNSKRYHPNLYMKLSRALREAGAPAPEGE